jgi:hypothetical protein
LDIKKWIFDLAGGFNFELTGTLVDQYVKILAAWKLKPQQWEKLNQRILLRYDYFPRISQLYEVACEILHEAEIKDSSDYLKEISNREILSGKETQSEHSRNASINGSQ